VIDLDVALGQQLLHIAVGQAVTQVPAHRDRDHLTREPVPHWRRRHLEPITRPVSGTGDRLTQQSLTDNPTTTADPQAQAPVMPPPHPALRGFDRFISTWEMRGRTQGSDVDDVVGIASYAWLPGGFFLEQRTKINLTSFAVEGVEIIRYDPETDTFPSMVYPSAIGSPLPYRWQLDGER
jgi:hypothetical protein